MRGHHILDSIHHYLIFGEYKDYRLAWTFTKNLIFYLIKIKLNINNNYNFLL